MHNFINRMRLVFFVLGLSCLFAPTTSLGVVFLDNQTQYSNQDPNNETRRSEHIRTVFGHYNRDSGMGGMTEAMAQGNLQMFEQEWNHIVVELGMHDWNESTTPAYIDGNKYKTNFNFLMTFNDGGGGGAYMSNDSHGFSYAMANPASCRWDPPSGATTHEMGHVWEGSAGGFNGTDSSGSWWECTANWIMLQYVNTYPQAGGYLYNSVFYPAHGRDMYDSWTIWEAAKDDPRYGTAWVNEIWTNANATQKVSEYILDRMIRLDASGSADKAGGMKDLWGDMAKKMVTWDFERQRWLAQANTPWNGDTWEWYTRCRAPLVKMPGNTGTYRPAREHMPQEYGFHYVPLTATAGTTVSCNFQPVCDFIRQSDWRACLVAVSNNGDARYSCLWNKGNNSITLSSDESQVYLCVIATPKPMKVVNTAVGGAWSMYTTDAGLQFPYTVSFTNASPTNVIYPVQSHAGMVQHANGLGWKSSTATVDSTAYIGPNAQVLDSARVLGNARIEEYGVVKGNAQVRDNAIVSGHAVVYENAQVYGNAKVRDWAMIFGNAQVYENAKAIEHAGCGGDNIVSGDVVMKGVTSVYSPSVFSGSLITDGDTANGNFAPGNANYVVANKGVHFGWQWGQNPAVFGVLADNKYQYSGLTFERQNAAFACDEFGINHGYLMNGCRNTIDSGASTRGGYVLALDGTSQYVELHNSLNDFKNLSVAVWVKWAGTATDQRIWSMGDGVNKQMYLTPKSLATNVVRMSIGNGGLTQYIDGVAALGNGWNHVVVTFAGTTGTLYVNGAQVGTTTLAISPDALNAPLMENSNYLGRGNSGNYFQGSVDDFRAYNKALSAAEVSALYGTAAPAVVVPTADTTAPTPNAATWLVAPIAISDSAITMSATPGTDASNWVEYYFACTAGGGHDSGWVSFNKYTDVGLTPGASYTYTVKMRDKNANTTADSAASGASTQTSSIGAASFAYGPVGISSTAIKMVATKLSAPSGIVEYNFAKMLPTGTMVNNSGWQSSPTWTDTGLAANASFKYSVQVRDGRGNVSAASAAVTATARDMAAPLLSIPVANWQMMPYSTIDNKISMTAQSVQESGASVYYQCVSGGGPDSGWIACTSTDDGGKTYYARWTTPNPLADGTYAYHYKFKDATGNESAFSTTYSGTIAPTTGYHSAAFSTLTTLADDCLVSFDGTVVAVNAENYVVRDLASSATITVKPDTYAQITDASFVFKNVTVKGHLYTIAGTRYVTYASLTALSSSAFSVSGKVTDSSGNAVAGAVVYFKSSANASVSPASTTTTDSTGNYTMPIINGVWYVCAGSAEHYTSADQMITVSGASVPNTNFVLNAKPKLTGKVTDQGSGGTAVAGATVCIRATTGVLASPTYTLTTDANGYYSQVVTPGTWYAASGKSGYDNTAEQSIVAADGVPSVINFSLIAPAPKNIPRASDLLFASLAEALPPTGNIPSWDTYSPVGTMSITGVPTVDPIGVKKWEKNSYSNSAAAKGFIQSTSAAAIPVNGATIVMLVKPTRNSSSTTTTSCVDIFNNELSLGVRNSTGRVNAYVNGTQTYAAANAITSLANSVVSLVVQPSGSFIGYVNGVQVLSGTSAAGMTSLDITNGTNIRVARGEGNTTSFNGNMGDVFVYKVALSDAERTQLETDITNRLNNTGTKYTITTSPGAGGTIVPGTASVYAGASQTVGIVANTGYGVSDVLVDGVSVGAVKTYTFTNMSANHTVSATFSPLTPYTITATVGAGGTLTPSGVLTVYGTTNQTFNISPNMGYTIASVIVDGVNQGALSTYTFSNILANHTIAVAFTNLNRNIPKTDSLIFGAVTESLPSSGAISSWSTIWPPASPLTAMSSPTASTINGKKWAQNLYNDGDGFRFGNAYASPVPVDGVSIVVAVKPTRNTQDTSWVSCVDIFYDRLLIGIKNSTGTVVVRRNGSLETSSATIPDGQVTILSCVVKPDGTYKVWANGTQIMTNTIASDMTSLVPGVPGDFGRYINVGRNNPDGWTTFNGYIGDVFVYKMALTDPDRQTLETDLINKFTSIGITASAGTGGTISPSGTVNVASGANQTFTITPNVGYVVSSVVVDGISQGAITSYTFNNVTVGHTISATFTVAKYTITASAGTGGTISPSGAQLVNHGTNKVFTITPSAGYVIGDVKIDNVSIGAVGTYTFTAVSAGHTIAATFNPNIKITASAGTGGTISPSGVLSITYGANQTFSISPSTGYSLADVLVDAASVGIVTSYTFNNVIADHTISALFAEDVASIAALKSKAADSLVKLTATETVIYAPKDATSARTTSFFYIGEAQGRGGLRVTDKTSDTLTIGNQVSNLVGYVRKPAGKEVYLELIADVTGTGNTQIKPIGANNKSALNDAKIQTNAVVVWGKVMSVNGVVSFEIGDGYSNNVKVVVNGIALPAAFDTTKTAMVSGVVTRDDLGNVVIYAQKIDVL